MKNNLNGFTSNVKNRLFSAQADIAKFKAYFNSEESAFYVLSHCQRVFEAAAKETIAKMILAILESHENPKTGEVYTEEVKTRWITNTLENFALGCRSLSSSATSNLAEHYAQQEAADMLRESKYYFNLAE